MGQTLFQWFWMLVSEYGPLQVVLVIDKQNSAFCMVHADFLLRIIFSSEDGGNMFLEKLVDFQLTTQCYTIEDRTLQHHCSLLVPKI
jgi:hypothetical protein